MSDMDQEKLTRLYERYRIAKKDFTLVSTLQELTEEIEALPEKSQYLLRVHAGKKNEFEISEDLDSMMIANKSDEDLGRLYFVALRGNVGSLAKRVRERFLETSLDYDDYITLYDFVSRVQNQLDNKESDSFPNCFIEGIENREYLEVVGSKLVSIAHNYKTSMDIAEYAYCCNDNVTLKKSFAKVLQFANNYEQCKQIVNHASLIKDEEIIGNAFEKWINFAESPVQFEEILKYCLGGQISYYRESCEALTEKTSQYEEEAAYSNALKKIKAERKTLERWLSKTDDSNHLVSIANFAKIFGHNDLAIKALNL